MMVGITKTRWTGRMSDFPEKMRAWELAVLRYQQATHAIVPDAVRCSIVAMHAPPAVKAYLRLAPTNVLVSYAALREKIFTYVPKPDPAATLKQGLPPVPKARASLLPRARARAKVARAARPKARARARRSSTGYAADAGGGVTRKRPAAPSCPSKARSLVRPP